MQLLHSVLAVARFLAKKRDIRFERSYPTTRTLKVRQAIRIPSADRNERLASGFDASPRHQSSEPSCPRWEAANTASIRFTTNDARRTRNKRRLKSRSSFLVSGPKNRCIVYACSITSIACRNADRHCSASASCQSLSWSSASVTSRACSNFW